MEYNDFVTNWVIDTVKEKYPQDIALVVSHTTLRIDGGTQAVSYFVPAAKRGNELARTFILDGVGYDIWGISWERLERFAELEEYNLTVLADGEILYAMDEPSVQRFEALKERQRKNLADRRKTRGMALSCYAQAKSLYLEMLFAQGSDIRLTAGYVLDSLARAIAFANHTYFKRSQTDQLEELKGMAKVPEGFSQRYLSVIKETDLEGLKRRCYDLIRVVQQFLSENQLESPPKEKNFQDLADWYGELSYTWLRLRHYGAEGDFIKVFMWGIFLQDELNHVCEDFGLEKQELMSYYSAGDLESFVRRSDEIERWMREKITEGSGVIHEYQNAEEFLRENP